jgi:hypothetical protein
VTLAAAIQAHGWRDVAGGLEVWQRIPHREQLGEECWGKEAGVSSTNRQDAGCFERVISRAGEGGG